MAYTQLHNYWLSDDFERFYRLVADNQTVVYTSDKTKGRLCSGNHRAFGLEKWGMKQKFRKYNIRFIDPECTFNPDIGRLTPNEPDGLWEHHAYEAETLHAIGDVFRRHAEIHGRLVDICGDIVDNWDFRINPSL